MSDVAQKPLTPAQTTRQIRALQAQAKALTAYVNQFYAALGHMGVPEPKIPAIGDDDDN